MSGGEEGGGVAGGGIVHAGVANVARQMGRGVDVGLRFNLREGKTVPDEHGPLAEGGQADQHAAQHLPPLPTDKIQFCIH